MLRAKSNIKHDGVLYEKGQEVQNLTEEQARKLIADGVLEDSTIAVSEEESSKTAETIEKETLEEIAQIEVKPTMSRTRLMGIARQRQIEVPAEATRMEIYNLLKKGTPIATEGADDSTEAPQE